MTGSLEGAEGSRSINSSVDPLHLAHAALEVQRLDVVPVLLKQRHQEVDCQQAVLSQFVLGHLDMTHSNTEAQHLLQLELDVAFDFGDFVLDLVAVCDERRELARLVQAGTQQTGDLRDQHLRGQESVVLLGEFLDEFLVLVEFLECLDVHEVDARLARLLAVHSVAQDAHLHPRTGHMRQLHSAGETFVPLRVIVLESDLQVDSLDELALLLLRASLDLRDSLLQRVGAQLTHFRGCCLRTACHSP
mmetsp:Transcript_2639/g.5979  ORF Transcript_2639/g.5979 Transcript_2639/m.5979 type:complete len:247 (+) Transcript_2639:252-992(+)